MEDQHQNKTVNNDGITLPEHDFAGLSQVISSAKPTLPATENGFIPLNDFDLAKPYGDIAKHLDERQKRLDESPIDPANAIEELKDEKRKLVDKHENDYEQRILDRDNDYRGRSEELEKHLAEVSRLKDAEIEIWRDRVDELKAKNAVLEQQRDDERNNLLLEIRNNHDQRMTDLERYHANELALTERYADKWERKLETDEERIRGDEKTLQEDRKNLFKTVLASIKNFSLAKLFK